MSYSTINPQIERELQNKLRRRFLDRLENKVKRIRRFFIDRNWSVLHYECRQLQSGAEAFNYPHIVSLAKRAETALGTSSSGNLNFDSESEIALENLISAIDTILLGPGEHHES